MGSDVNRSVGYLGACFRRSLRPPRPFSRKLGVAGVDSNFATAVRTTVVVLLAWAIALATKIGGKFSCALRLARGSFSPFPGLATGLSWLCYFRALQLGPASRVAPIDKLSVVLVIGFAALFLGETFNAWARQ